MKKKLPIAPVRATVRGTCAVQAISMLTPAARLDRLRQRHRQHRLVVRVVIVGRDETPGRGPLAAVDGNRRDVEARPLVGAAPAVVVAAAQRPFAHERRAGVLPRVPVEVELEIRRRPAGDVAPGDRLGCR
jgi:hypothetical protein